MTTQRCWRRFRATLNRNPMPITKNGHPLPHSTNGRRMRHQSLRFSGWTAEVQKRWREPGWRVPAPSFLRKFKLCYLLIQVLTISRVSLERVGAHLNMGPSLLCHLAAMLTFTKLFNHLSTKSFKVVRFTTGNQAIIDHHLFVYPFASSVFNVST